MARPAWMKVHEQNKCRNIDSQIPEVSESSQYIAQGGHNKWQEIQKLGAQPTKGLH